MTKAQRIEEYNQNNKGYCITDIKKMSKKLIGDYRVYGASSLHECYVNPSDHKIISYNKILQTYRPQKIISVRGSSFTYTVLLKAHNGDILHITKANNYLVDIED